MYDYASLMADLEVLKGQGAQVFSIGKTVLGRDIPCVFKGVQTGGQTIIQASMHAREYPTTPLVIEMMKNYDGTAGVWCVPMVNIDGALLSQIGLPSVADAERADFLLDVNGGSQDFSQWKANANAVDINVNFNANWGTGASNVRFPSPANYIGPFPNSEPETKALTRLTEMVQPKITLSYHTKGDVIFWGYKNIAPYPQYTQRFSVATGYPLEESFNSAGGYKDWFVLTTGLIGLTFEVGSPSLPTPIPLSAVPKIFERNKTVLSVAEGIIKEIQ